MRVSRSLSTMLRGRGRAITVVLAVVVGLSVPLGALVTDGSPLLDWLGGPTAAPATNDATSGTPLEDVVEPPEPDLKLARDLLLEAGRARGVSVTPLPLPTVSLTDPLGHALREWMFVQHGAAGDAYLGEALAQAADVPHKAREPLALILLAHAQATQLQRDALASLTPAEGLAIQAAAENPAALARLVTDPPAWAEAATAKVDLAKSVQAAALLLDAAHEALPKLQAAAADEDHDLLGRELGGFTDDGPGPLSDMLPVLDAATPKGDLKLLDDVLGYLIYRERVDAMPAVPLTEMIASFQAGGLDLSGLVPAGPGALPHDLDRALGQVFAAAIAAPDLLATQGPGALAAAHLVRVRSMQAALPTLTTWSQALATLPIDTRLASQPWIAGGDALDRAARVPSANAGVAELVAFGLERPVPRSFPAAASADELIPAFEAFYLAAGQKPAAGWQASYADALGALTPDQQRGLATLLQGQSEAMALIDRATLQLSPADKEWLVDNLPTVQAWAAGTQLTPAEHGVVQQVLTLAGHIDNDLVHEAALTMAAAADTARELFGPAAPVAPAAGPGLAGTGPTMPASSHEDVQCPDTPVSDCDNGIYFTDPLGLVIVGGPGPSSYESPDGDILGPLLLVDLGGNDQYTGSVATAFFRPALALDLGGQDTFTGNFGSQGAGILGGVGLLVQADGDTRYTIGQQGQGFGAVGGVGALVDLGGNDTYRGEVFVQGVGLFGAGLLLDRSGDDTYRSKDGTGRRLGGVLADLQGKDTYDDGNEPQGIPLDKPFDSDYVQDAIFDKRQDNAIWLDGSSLVDLGFGIDIETDQIDHDGDGFPSLVEALVGTDAADGDSNIVTFVNDTTQLAGDEDDDGALNVVEEAMGTDAQNDTQAGYALPSTLPLVPEELAAFYEELRGEASDAPPPSGMIVDLRMPFHGRTSLDCPYGVVVCPKTEGSDDEQVQETHLEHAFGTNSDLALRSEGTIGLVAIGDVLDSTFELPYLFSLDLGGNDTYLDGAGGAVVVENALVGKSGGSGTGLTVTDDGISVNLAGGLANQFTDERTGQFLVPLTHLDLAGDDTYLGGELAHGAGGGLLVDLGGHDIYNGTDLTQGALGGVLFDGGGDDTYLAGHTSQGAALPAANFTAFIPGSGTEHLVRAGLRSLHSTVSARTLQPSLLLDAGGDDTYTAGDQSQGYAAVPKVVQREDAFFFSGTSTNGTQLTGQLLDLDGDDAYRAGAYSQAVAGPGGLALLVDRNGTDDYHAGGLVSQASVDTRSFTRPEGRTDPHWKMPGLALLLDAAGGDLYVANASDQPPADRTLARNDNVTERRVPLHELGTGTGDLAAGQSLAFLEAVHADLEASERDSDGDGWPDGLEALLGTSTRDDTDAPTPTSQDALHGFLVNIPAAGLAIGDREATAYVHDYILSIDLGGANTYINNAGGPIIDALVEEGALEDGKAARNDVTILQHPTTALIDAGLDGSTFTSARDLVQGASLFTVGVLVTAAGENTFTAPSSPRAIYEAPKGPTVRIDGFQAPTEWPRIDEIAWHATDQRGLDRHGTFAATHDGEFLYLSARIPDPTPDKRDNLDQFRVYISNNATEGRLFDRLVVGPKAGGTVDDEFLKNLAWLPDATPDPNRTSTRMTYAGGAWTLELARPISETQVAATFQVNSTRSATQLHLDLCQPTRVVDPGPFNEVDTDPTGKRIVLSEPIERSSPGDAPDELEPLDTVSVTMRSDAASVLYERWWWQESADPATSFGGNEVRPDECKFLEAEDVTPAAGNLSAVFVEFVDADTGETWRFPSTGTAVDGAQGFETNGRLTEEVRGWLPLFPETTSAQVPTLRDGPRLTQGGAAGGVSILASVSALRGHDTYEAHQDAQGAGVLGGIGMLVDLGGSDTYLADAWSQGAARGDSYALLYDHDGNDIYEARAFSQGVADEQAIPGDGTGRDDVVGALDRIQPRGLFVDLSGYDHYEYDAFDAKTAYVALRAAETRRPYKTYEGNDWVWTQGKGGIGGDTFLPGFYQTVAGGSITVDFENFCTQAPDQFKQVCRPTSEPRVEFDLGAVHQASCLFEDVPWSDEPGGAPFPEADGATVLNGTVCVRAHVSLIPDRGVEPERVELLRDSQRQAMRFSPVTISQGEEGRVVYQYRLTVDTSTLADGNEDWRIVAYMAAASQEDAADVVEGIVAKRELFLSQAFEQVLLSNLPFATLAEARATAFSPTPAIGRPGLPLDLELTHDISQDRLERAGYIADATNIACPFDPGRLCNRYPLYLKPGSEMSPDRPEDPDPVRGQTTEDISFPKGDGSNYREPSGGNVYRHGLLAPIELTGGEPMGLVADGAADVNLPFDLEPGLVQLAYSGPDDDTIPYLKGGAVYALTSDAAAQREVLDGVLRLTRFAGRGPGTITHTIDLDVFNDHETRSFPVEPTLGFADLAAPVGFGPGDALYLDINGNGVVDPAAGPMAGHAGGDVRLVHPDPAVGNGSQVLPGDADADPSAPVALTPTRVPGVVDNVNILPQADAVLLTWEPPTDSGNSPIAGYDILRAEDGGELTHLATVAPGPAGQPVSYRDELPAATLDPLDPDVFACTLPHDYVVVARNALGAGLPSLTFTTRPRGCSEAPTELTAVAGPGRGEVTLTWSPPGRTGGVAITGYNVTREDVQHRRIGNLTTFTDTGLPDGAVRCYTLTPLTTVTEGEPSAEACATTYEVPGRPTNLRTVPGPGIDRITVLWDEPASTGGAPIDSYAVKRDGLPHVTVPAAIQSYIDVADQGAGDSHRATIDLPSGTPGALLVEELEINPMGPDRRGGEFVVLRNGDHDRDLTGWTVVFEDQGGYVAQVNLSGITAAEARLVLRSHQFVLQNGSTTLPGGEPILLPDEAVRATVLDPEGFVRDRTPFITDTNDDDDTYRAFVTRSQPVLIQEIEADPPGADADNREYVEVQNMGPDTLDVSGWAIIFWDADFNYVAHTNLSGTLAPGQRLVRDSSDLERANAEVTPLRIGPIVLPEAVGVLLQEEGDPIVLPNGGLRAELIDAEGYLQDGTPILMDGDDSSDTNQRFRDEPSTWGLVGGTEGAVNRATVEGPINRVPGAYLSFSCEDLECAFDAELSEDPDGRIVSYAWDFSDGSIATGRSVNHSFDGPGVHDVILTIHDDATENCWRVWAANVVGTGLKTATSPCPDPSDPTEPRSPPQDLQAKPGSGSGAVDVSWSKPLVPPGDPDPSVAGYMVYRDGAFIAEVASGTLQHADGPLPHGTYCYIVTAVRTDGWQSDLPTSAACTQPAGLNATPVLDLTVESGVRDASQPDERLLLNVSWTAPLDDQGWPVTRYNLYRDGTLYTTVGPDTFRFVDDNSTTPGGQPFADGDEHCYSVTAVNAGGESGPVADVCGETLRAPDPPANAAADGGPDHDAVTLSWDAPFDGGSPLTGYNVSQGGQLLELVDAGTRRFTLAGLAPATEHCFNITAVNARGESDTAPEVCATPPGRPFTLQSWRGLDLDGDGVLGVGDVVYIDADASRTVTPGDVRLGTFPTAPGAAARLTYYHQALYDDRVSLHARLITGTGSAFQPIVDDQTVPYIAEAYGTADVNQLTPFTEPGGDEVPGWSQFWLPFDQTRTYPPTATAGPGAASPSQLSLHVRASLQEPTGDLPDGGGSNSNFLLGCTAEGATAARGICWSIVYFNNELAPSRLELFVPTETDLWMQLNATLAGETFARNGLEKAIEGGIKHRIDWAPSGFPDGVYQLNLSAFEFPPSVVDGELVFDATEPRWSETVPVAEVLLDGTPPTSEAVVSRFVGTTQIDPLTDSFKVRWDLDDGDVSAGVGELRVYAAGGESPQAEDYRLISVVRNVERQGVDVLIDGREDTYHIVTVARDEVGNVEGINPDDNLWPGHRCTDPLPAGIELWPPEDPKDDRLVIPELDENCFATEGEATRAAFLIALQNKVASGETTVTTVDRNIPAFTSTAFTLSDGIELPVLRVDDRQVRVLQAGQDARVSACVSKQGPSEVQRVNLFLITTLDNGTTVQRKNELVPTGLPTCYAFDGLANATADGSAYPEGFYTAGLEVLDEAGNIAEESFGIVYLDGGAPQIVEGGLIFPHGQSAVIEGQELIVDAVAIDPTGINGATLSAPGLNASSPLELKVGRTGSLTGRMTVDRAVPDGTYRVHLNVTDGVNNTLVDVIEVPVDSTPVRFVEEPTLLGRDAARSTDAVAASTQPDGFTLSFTTDTPSRYRVLAGTNPARLGLVDEHLGNFSTEHEARVTGLAPSEGYFVEVEAWSPGGITATSDVLQVLTGPSFALDVTTPQPGQALGTRSSIAWNLTQVANTTLDDGSPISVLISVRRSAATPWETVGGTAATLGPGAMELDLGTVPNGRTYALRLEASAAGERATTIVEPITIDKEPPTALLTAPVGGWTNQSRPQLTFELADSLSGLAATPVTSAEVDGGPASVVHDNGTVLVTPTRALGPGAHTVLLHVTDAAGNVGETVARIHVDTRAPTLEVLSLDDAVLVRPGAPLTVEATAEDDGELALLEARLGDSVARQVRPGPFTALVLPAPAGLSQDLPLVVRLVDAAGNTAELTRQVRLDATPPNVLDVDVRAGTTEARILVTASETVRVFAPVDGTTRVAGPAERVELKLTGLTPGRTYSLDATVRDLAGNAVPTPITFTTEPDLVPPTAPANVTARALPDGTVALAWRPATDNTGIAAYEVLRATVPSSGTTREAAPVGRADTTRFIDEDVRPGATYRYEVRAIDLGNRVGPTSASEPVTPVGQARLTNPVVSPEIGTPDDTFTFRILFHQPGGHAPGAVSLVLDGTRIPMQRADGTAELGIAYQVAIPVRPHGPEGPHMHHFEATTETPTPQTLRYPATGELEGPLVTVLEEPGDALSGIAALQRSPVGIAVGLVALAGAAIALVGARRWRP